MLRKSLAVIVARLRWSIEDWLGARPLTAPAPRDAWALNVEALRSATSEGMRRSRADREVYTASTMPRPPLRLVDIHGDPLTASEEPLQ